MSERRILELEEENSALREIISHCRSVLSNLHYDWVDIEEKVGKETMRYYDGCESDEDEESDKESLSFKSRILDYFDENWFCDSNKFLDHLKDSTELESDCLVQSLDCMVSVSARVCWNNQIIRFHYYSDDSFSNFGTIELNGKTFSGLCPEYSIEMKSVMDSLNVPHNNDPNLIYKFHVLLADLALFQNQSEYDLTDGDCYTFTNQFRVSTE